MFRNCPEEPGIARCLRTGYPTTINPFARYDDDLWDTPWDDVFDEENEDEGTFDGKESA